jgi:hypothetical protein
MKNAEMTEQVDQNTWRVNIPNYSASVQKVKEKNQGYKKTQL